MIQAKPREKNHQVDHSNGSRSLPQGLLLVKPPLLQLTHMMTVCKALFGHRVSDFQQNISAPMVRCEMGTDIHQ